MSHILIVDDLPQNLYLLRALLQGYGYAVKEAVNGAEALIKAREDVPDLVISDLLMPVMDGYTFLRQWKADERLKNIPFMVYTSTYTDTKDRHLALQIGADAFIIKPAEPESLMAQIREVLAKKERGESPRGYEGQFEEKALFKEYSEVLIHKLEEKALQLEELNRALVEEIAERKQAEMASFRLAAIVQSSADAIIGHDLDGLVTSWNYGAEKIFDYTAQEMIGTSIMRLIPANQEDDEHHILETIKVGGSVEHLETQRQTKGGRLVDVSLTVSPIKDSSGRVIGASQLMRNITERKRAESIFRANRELLANIIKSTPSYIFATDRKHHYILANDSFARFLGKTIPEIMGRQHRDFYPSEMAEALIAENEKIMATGETSRSDEIFMGAAMIIVKFPLRDADGIVNGLCSVATDISERQLAEKALRASEERLRIVTNNARIGLVMIDRERRYTFANATYSEIMGLPPGQLIGQSIREVLPQLYDEQIRPRLDLAFTGERVAYELRRPTPGGDHWYAVRYEPTKVGDLVSLVVVVITEITERKQMEEAQRASEERYRTLFEYAPDGIIISDSQNVFIDANARICRMLGYTRDELVGLSGADIVVPDQFKDIEQALVAVKIQPSFQREWQFRRKDGSVFDADVIATTMPDGNLMGMIRDITERKQSELRIRRLNRVYAVLSDINQMIVREKDAQAMLNTACQIAVDKGLFSMAWIGLLDASDNWIHVRANAGADPQTLEILDRLLGTDPESCRCHATLQALQTSHHGICNVIASDAQWKFWRDTDAQHNYRAMASLPLQAGGSTIGTFNLYVDKEDFFDDDEMRLLDELAMDIGFAMEVQQKEKERKGLETQFHQAQKMEAFGQLAGGVAHDFNNFLTVITGYTQLLLQLTSAEDSRRGPLQEILKAGERSVSLTRQLLAFSRKQVLAPRVLDLNEVVHNTEKMLQRLIGEDISLTAALHPQLDAIKADSGQVEQVLLNLAVNARDAMPRGGKLTIETANIELDQSYVQHHVGARPGKHVMLAVTDTGTGMTDEVKQHLFEPFFTTKELGRGTGLGLAVVHGIVKQSSGTIEVYSEVGIGTSFKIYFPRAEKADTIVQLAPTSQSIPRGNEVLLLVEDEVSVRTMARHILQDLGYTVWEAGQAEDALHLAKEHQDSIQLLLTDVVMPGLGGRVLAEQLLVLHPEMKVLYMSGYTDDAIVRHGILHEQVNFLQKPFSPSSLAHKVREVLNT